MKRLDLTGHKYGQVEVLAFSHIDKHGKANWKCQCVCGQNVIRSSNTLRSKNFNSCGCLRTKYSHGMSNKDFRPYRIWKAMKQRCYYKKGKQYKDYGGRGIKVCKEWKESFDAFWNDMKWTYDDGLTLDRRNNDYHYCKSNCRWVTQKEQNNNKRKNPSYGV